MAYGRPLPSAQRSGDHGRCHHVGRGIRAGRGVEEIRFGRGAEGIRSGRDVEGSAGPRVTGP